MKTLKFIFLLTFVIGVLSSNDANSQTIKTIQTDVIFKVRDAETGDEFELENGNGVTFEISNGNYLRKVTFKFDDGHEIMQFDGPNLLIRLSIYEKDENGEKILIVRDAMSVLTRSGNLQFIFHQNGAGISLPRGW